MFISSTMSALWLFPWLILCHFGPVVLWTLWLAMARFIIIISYSIKVVVVVYFLCLIYLLNLPFCNLISIASHGHSICYIPHHGLVRHCWWVCLCYKSLLIFSVCIITALIANIELLFILLSPLPFNLSLIYLIYASSFYSLKIDKIKIFFAFQQYCHSWILFIKYPEYLVDNIFI